jgi:hypothetical protein
MKLLISLLIFIVAIEAWSYELVAIQAISTTKKTFITRKGKRDGVIPGVTGTFVADDVAMLSKAKTVTGEYTHWELINPEAALPFAKGQIVTYHPAEEYVWTLMKDEKRKTILESKFNEPKKSVLIKTAMTRGLSESTSEAYPGNTRRGGLLYEILYEKEYFENLALDIGARYEKEIVIVSEATLTTQRLMLIGDVLYYIPGLEDLTSARIYLGLGLGYGESSTATTGSVSSGTAMLIPAAKIGGSMRFNRDYHFILEGAFETLQTTEKLPVGGTQTTNQSNMRVGIGIRKYF